MPLKFYLLLRFHLLLKSSRGGAAVVNPQDLIDNHADVSDGDLSVAVGVGTVLREAAVVGQLQDAVHHHSDVRH